MALERKERVAHGGLFTWDFIRASTYDSGRPGPGADARGRRGGGAGGHGPCPMAAGPARGPSPHAHATGTCAPPYPTRRTAYLSRAKSIFMARVFVAVPPRVAAPSTDDMRMHIVAVRSTLWLAALGARRFRPPQTSCVSIPLAVTSGEELHCLLIVLVGGRSVKEEHGDVGTGDLHCGVVEALV